MFTPTKLNIRLTVRPIWHSIHKYCKSLTSTHSISRHDTPSFFDSLKRICIHAVPCSCGHSDLECPRCGGSGHVLAGNRVGLA
jgi:hypothetical protein